MKATLKLSAVCLGLMAFWQEAQAADINHTCTETVGCGYANFDGKWHLENENKYVLKSLGSDSDKLNVSLEAKHYQNKPVTTIGTVNDGGYLDANDDLIFFSNFYGTSASSLTIPEGASLTLSEFTEGASVVEATNTLVNVAKGVTITLNPTYGEKYRAKLPESEKGIYDAGEAFDIDGSKAVLNSSADLILNGENAAGVYIYDDATANLTDHRIELNGRYNVALENGGGVIKATKLNIKGDKDIQSAIIAGSETSSLTELSDSQVSLTGKNSSLIRATIYDDGKDNVNINQVNSNSENTIIYLFGKNLQTNIKQSQLVGRENFVLIDTGDEDEEEKYVSANHPLIINAEQSELSGAINPTADNRAKIDLTLTNNSHWQSAKSSTLTNLALDNSIVTIQPNSGDFRTITITGDLSGNGRFQLNTDLAEQKSDQIIVQGKDSGNFGLVVQNSGAEPKSEGGKVTLVKTQTGTAKFSLFNRNYVDLGAYRYRLRQNGNDWELSNQASEKADPSSNTSNNAANNGSNSNVNGNTNSGTAVNNGGSSSTTTTEIKSLAGASNSLVSLRQAQLIQMEQDLVGIHQRLGEVKGENKGNVWVRNVNGRAKMGSTETASDSRSSGFKQDYYSLQVGTDFAVSDNFRLGGFVGKSRSDVDFNQDYGSGKVKTTSLGVYGTLMFNNGFYMDNIAKYDRLKAESNSTDTRHYNGYTLSSEIGRIHTLGSGWTVTPQLQLAWTSINGKADEDRLSALTARAGVRVGKALQLGEWALQPYAEVNAITTKNRHSQVRVNQYAFDVASSRGRFETALGLNVQTGNHRLGIEAKTASGKRLDEPFAVQGVYRYQW